MRIYVGLSVYTHIHLCFYQFFCLSIFCRITVHFFFWISIFILLMLPRICAGSPKAMQQVDIVQSRMSLRCSRGKCNYILAPPCAHSLLEKEVNIIFFFFQPLVYVHNQMFKCRLLITFENSSGPTKCSRENACMCRLVSAFAAQKKCSVSFSAPICVLNHLLLVSSADNLYKQLGPRSDRTKLSCENDAHVKSRKSRRCWRGKFFLFLKCTFLFFNFLSYFIALSFLSGIAYA